MGNPVYSDLVYEGDGQNLLFFYASSEIQGMMKEVTVVNGPVSCVVNTYIRVRNPDGTYAVCNSSVNVPWTNYVRNDDTGKYEFAALEIPLYVAPAEGGEPVA